MGGKPDQGQGRKVSGSLLECRTACLCLTRDILPLEVPTNTVYAGMDYDIQGIDIDAMGSDVQNLELLPIIPLHQGASTSRPVCYRTLICQ